MEIIITFITASSYGFYLAAPLLILVIMVIIFLGQIVGRIESWQKYEALYWPFITATTVGYGDVRPTSRTSKALSVIIALTGLIFTGIVVAVAVNSATYALNEHVDFAQLKETLDK